ncbi:DNase II-like protein [Mudlarkpox virus]|nr:DNase II-like protein [Mudlarkpox virus]
MKCNLHNIVKMIKKILLVSLLIGIVITGFLFSDFFSEVYTHRVKKSLTDYVTCVNEEGKMVDWYIVYKLPRSKRASTTGSSYVYIDNINTTWRLGINRVESQNSIFGRTLQPIYDSYKNNNNPHVGYILFNDGVPEVGNYSTLFGHTKGVISWTLYGGIYLTHSVPKFPPFPMRGYSYPRTGTKYGQTALCISLPYQDIIELDSIIPVNNPRAYNCSIPSVDINNMNNFRSICVERIINTIINATTWITSEKGEEFLLFAKSRNYKKDIMSSWILPTLKSDLLAETWLHGEKLPTICRDQVHVYNIAAVSVDTFDFINYNDHSKWIVSLNEIDGWVCIGDINRAPTQRMRGGGYTCSKNIDMYNALRDAVTVFEGCELGLCSSFVDDDDVLINSTCPVASY